MQYHTSDVDTNQSSGTSSNVWVCVRVPIPPSNSPTLAGCVPIQLRADTTCRRWQILQAKSTVLQDHPPPQVQMPIASPGCCSCWTTSYRSEVPITPSLGSINWSQNSDTFCLLEYRLPIKRYNSGISKWKRCMGPGMGIGHGTPMASPGTPLTLPAPPRVHQPRSHPNLSFCIFTEASLHRHD